jgi:multiple sugar transport system ATP-binding protein
MAVIEINALRKEFSVPDGTEVAVDGVDYAIEEGEFFTIVGPSGCGKTTTLRCLAGLETPTSGTVRLDSREVTDVPANKRNVAMMFQSIALYPHMTVRENI